MDDILGEGWRVRKVIWGRDWRGSGPSGRWSAVDERRREGAGYVGDERR